jgi:hypothetical protein
LAFLVSYFVLEASLVVSGALRLVRFASKADANSQHRCSTRTAINGLIGRNHRHNFLPNQDRLWRRVVAKVPADAMPPSSVMNSRRLMGAPPQAYGRTLARRCARTSLCITAKIAR